MLKQSLDKSRKNIVKIFLLCLVIVLGLIFWYRSRIARPYMSGGDGDARYRVSQTSYQNKFLPTEDRITDLINKMTLEEKIGQMALVEKNSIHNKEDIAYYGLGALLSGGGAKPDPNTPLDWLRMVNDFQSYAQKTRLKIPLLYGVDAVHGHAGVPGATIFPHQIGLAATQDKELIKKIYQATAQELMATGIYWNFAPSLDIPTDFRWGRTYETFGQDQKTVELLGPAAIEGLQQISPSGTISVLATAKHYLGTGVMVWGTSSNKDFKIDQGDARVSEAALRQTHIPVFKKAIDSGVMSIMVGLNSWNDKKIASDKYLLTDLLKNELGFRGFVVSDWYGVHEISPNTYDATVIAINAGIDMVMLPYDYHSFTANLKRAFLNGDISTERIDEAVRRILRAKFSLGLFDRPLADASALDIVGSAQHRELARQAVRQSLVLLKNQDAVLPLSKHLSPIIVAGTAADNIGRQSGGWTVEWQGIDGNWLPAATSIVQGIRNVLARTDTLLYDEQGNFNIQTKAPVGVAIVGERPYAEGWGDSDNLKLSNEDLEIIRKVKMNSEKIIVVVISGRPLDIKNEAKDWDGVVAAWLPGSEGGGVADALFGDYTFSGTLPLSWEL